MLPTIEKKRFNNFWHYNKININVCIAKLECFELSARVKLQAKAILHSKITHSSQ